MSNEDIVVIFGGFFIGILFTLFFVYGPMEHGARCLPYNQRTPGQQERDSGEQRRLLENEVKMIELRIQRAKLEKKLEPRLF